MSASETPQTFMQALDPFLAAEESSETPLTDSVQSTITPDGAKWIHSSDCRTIERRLNACLRQLEYYRRFMPHLVGLSEEDYAKSQEAKNTDEAIANARKPL